MTSIRSFVRYTIALLAIIVLLASFLWGKNVELSSKWVPQGITVDGQISDWPENAMSFLNDPEVTVGFCNDSTRAYILVCSRKPDLARSIKMTGLTIYLDPKAEKGKDFYIRFQGGPSREEIIKASGETAADSTRQIPPEMLQRMQERERSFQPKFSCFQKDVIVEKPIEMNGSQGPSAAFGIDKGFFIYEFSVPLKESTVRDYGIGVEPGKPIGLGMIWGEFDRSRMGEGGGEGRGGGLHGGFGGGGEGGGMGGGGFRRGGEGSERGEGGGFRGRGNFQAPKKQEVWLKVQLATEQ